MKAAVVSDDVDIVSRMLGIDVDTLFPYEDDIQHV